MWHCTLLKEARKAFGNAYGAKSGKLGEGKKVGAKRGETNERNETKANKGKAKASVEESNGESNGGQDTCYKEFLEKCEAVRKVYGVCTCTQCMNKDGKKRAPWVGRSSPSDTCPAPEWATPSWAKNVVEECIEEHRKQNRQCRTEEGTSEQEEEIRKGEKRRRVWE